MTPDADGESGPDLRSLGWRGDPVELEPGLTLGRVGVEHRGAYEVLGPSGVHEAAVAPTLRRLAESPIDFPAVGDWVAHTTEPRHDRRLQIERILPRTSTLVRRAPGPDAVPQIVGANVDVVAIVTTATEDLNERRLERYLALIHGGGAQPLVLVNKVDLGDADVAVARVRERIGDVEVIATSAVDGTGLAAVSERLADGKTLAFTGSSGVGKSTIVNVLLGEERQETADVRGDGRGRHTTVRRHLLLVPGGGVVVDTPGLREIRLWDAAGLDATFPELADLAQQCRFADCTHRVEPDCALRDAVAEGRASADRVDALVGLLEELAELEQEIEERERILERRRTARSRPGGRGRVTDR